MDKNFPQSRINKENEVLTHYCIETASEVNIDPKKEIHGLNYICYCVYLGCYGFSLNFVRNKDEIVFTSVVGFTATDDLREIYI